MKVHKRLQITLLEILVVVAILALFTGVIGINVRRAMQNQRFRTEVYLMVDTLRLAQDLMLVLGTDVHFRIKGAEDNGGIEYWLDVEGGVPKSWKPVVDRSRRLLKEIHHSSFFDLQPFPFVEGEVDIRFLSGGALMSRGILRLATHENPDEPGSIKKVVCLKGYPHAIVSEFEAPNEEIDCFEDEDIEENKRLTFYTVQEVLEDVASKPVEDTPTEPTDSSSDVKKSDVKTP